ncbi:MAG: ABC transporter permease [Oscillospiraceae bacterium]|jgi:ABC-2 type transport system permease protein
MSAIFKREFRSYFHTMTGPVFIAVVTGFVGLYFMIYNMITGYPYFAYPLVSSWIVLVIAVPILTMRSFAEERKSKTDQILLTSPVRVIDIVMGKYLAMVAVFAIATLFLCLCPLIISSVGTAYFLVDYSTILCFFIVGCLYIAIGMYISSLTESQLIAAILSFVVLMVMYLWYSIVNILPTDVGGTMAVLLIILALICLVIYSSTKNVTLSMIIGVIGMAAMMIVYIVNSSLYEGLLSKILGDFSIIGTFYNFMVYYTFDLVGLLKMVIWTAVMVFLTGQSIQKRRWN